MLQSLVRGNNVTLANIECNIVAAYQALKHARLRVRAEATGGDFGRTVKLYIATGKITVKTLRDGEHILTDGFR
jgi:chemotaxis receptor (MCP) glutamine deamidase CheD